MFSYILYYRKVRITGKIMMGIVLQQTSHFDIYTLAIQNLHVRQKKIKILIEP